MANTIRKTLYETVADVKDQIKTRKGPIGKTIGGLERAASEIATGAQTIAREFKEGAGEMYTEIRKAGISISKKTKDLYNSIQDSLYIGGRFNSDRAKEALKNKGEAIKKYGEKAYNSLVRLVEKAGDAITEDIQDHFVSEEELKGKYAGIGTEYNWGLLRENYEACLNFAKDLDAKLGKSKYKPQIIADAKAAASSNLNELRKYYAEILVSDDERRKLIPDKLKVLNRCYR